jgi:hypothetical protein
MPIKLQWPIVVVGETVAPPPPIPPAFELVQPEHKIAVLTAAYNKHVGALAAIESSQQSLLNLVLGIYSAALTLLVGLFKDDPSLLNPNGGFLSPLGYVLVVAGGALAVYTLYMSHGRNEARKAVRIALERVDFAFGFFENGAYLKAEQLYPPSFREYTKRSFLAHTQWVAYLPAVAFILAVIILSQAAAP